MGITQKEIQRTRRDKRMRLAKQFYETHPEIGKEGPVEFRYLQKGSKYPGIRDFADFGLAGKMLVYVKRHDTTSHREGLESAIDAFRKLQRILLVHEHIEHETTETINELIRNMERATPTSIFDIDGDAPRLIYGGGGELSVVIRNPLYNPRRKRHAPVSVIEIQHVRSDDPREAIYKTNNVGMF